MHLSSVSSDNFINESVSGWIISPLLMQKLGETVSMNNLPSYLDMALLKFDSLILSLTRKILPLAKRKIRVKQKTFKEL